MKLPQEEKIDGWLTEGVTDLDSYLAEKLDDVEEKLNILCHV